MKNETLLNEKSVLLEKQNDYVMRGADNSSKQIGEWTLVSAVCDFLL
jgi:hypothetical protein